MKSLLLIATALCLCLLALAQEPPSTAKDMINAASLTPGASASNPGLMISLRHHHHHGL